MTKSEKITRLMSLNNAFEGVVEGLVGSLRRDFQSMQGMTPERMRFAENALARFADKLHANADMRQTAVAAAYETLDENIIDAMLVLSCQPRETADAFASAVMRAQNQWRDASLAETPDLMDLLFSAGASWGAANTEGEVAKSLEDLSEPPSAA